jgi:predicted TIM-barrel fold metal-dependent hydrolase
MIKFYDTHVHIPSPTEEGLELFLEYVKSTPEMLGGLLILNTQEDVDFVASNLKRIPTKFIIVPCYDFEDKNYPVEITSSNWVKIHPVLSKISDNKIDTVIRFIKDKRKALNGVIVHCFPWGTEMEYNFSLELVLELNNHFPEMKILIAHGGGYESWIFRAHTGSIRNIFYDFSVTLKYYQGSDLLKPFQRYLLYSSDRILFGSDYPIAGYKEQMDESIRLALEVGLDEKTVESIYINNFKKIWGNLLKD